MESVLERVVDSPDAVAIRDFAIDEGMGTMREDGRRKVLDGLTTSQEVLRAIRA